MMVCPYCGRLLADGEECNCRSTPAPDRPAGESAHAPAPQPEVRVTAIPPRPGAARLFFRNVRQCFCAYFVNPANAIDISARIRDIRTGLFFAGLQAVFTGLFFPALLLGISLSLSHTATSALAQNLNGAASVYATTSIAILLSQMRLAFPPLFLLAFLMAAVIYFAVSTAGWLFGIAARRRTSYRAMLAAVGVASIPSLCLTALGCVFALFWPGAGLLFLTASVFTSIVSSYAATKISLEADDSRLSMLYGLIWAVVLAVAVAVAFHILPYLISLPHTIVD